MILFTLLLSLHSLAASINSSSNISEQRVAVAVKTDNPEKPLELLLLRLEDMRSKSIPLPLLPREEIMGLVLSKEHLILISQKAVGDANPALVHLYKMDQEKWLPASEVSCHSYDTIEIKEAKLFFHCEKAHTAVIEIPKDFARQKIRLPMEQNSSPSYNYSLNGDLFRWNTMVINKQKKLSALDLLKTK